MFLHGVSGLVLKRVNALPTPWGSRWYALGMSDRRTLDFNRAGTGEHRDAVLADPFNGAQRIAELFTELSRNFEAVSNNDPVSSR